MRKEIVFTLGYLVLVILCMMIIEKRYGDLPPRSWPAMLFVAMALAWIGKRLEKWVVNAYGFFAVVVLVLLICFDSLYELLFYLS
jgi:uncharacterized membrane protein YhaH (DUF805 family)